MGRINTGGVKKKIGDNVATSSSVSGTTLKLTPPKGYYDGVGGTVNITDSDYIESNIKTGTNLFGKVGTAYNWSPTFGSGSTLLINLTETNAVTNVPYSGFYSTANTVTGSPSASITGITNGFYFIMSTNTTACSVPYYSGGHGYGQSGLQIISNQTGQVIRWFAGVNSVVGINSILMIHESPTTIKLITNYLIGSNSTFITQGQQQQLITVASNFFTSGIRFRDFIDIAYSAESTYTYRARTYLQGEIWKF